MSGKGSKPRTTKKYAENFDKVFKKSNNLIYPLEYDKPFFDPKEFPNLSSPEKAYEAGKRAANNLKKYIP